MSRKEDNSLSFTEYMFQKVNYTKCAQAKPLPQNNTLSNAIWYYILTILCYSTKTDNIYLFSI